MGFSLIRPKRPNILLINQLVQLVCMQCVVEAGHRGVSLPSQVFFFLL
jgi:hypothetical protein